MKIRLHSLVAVLLAQFTFSALAHEVWIEDTKEGQLVVRFAEYGDVYEKSPGNLDSLNTPVAFEAGELKSTMFEVQKKSDHFLLVNASPTKAAQADTGFTVIDSNENDPDRLRQPIDGKKPSRKPFFYARWQPAGGGAVKPAMNLDIVPTGKPGEVCVYFRGKPLPEVKVSTYVPGGDDKELVTDKDGLVTVEIGKPGLYLVTVKRHRETASGFAEGRFYELVSHNASLAWRQP